MEEAVLSPVVVDPVKVVKIQLITTARGEGIRTSALLLTL